MYVSSGSEKNNIFEKISVPLFGDDLVNDENFRASSVITWLINLIFELERDIDERILCTKFQVNRM